MIEMFKIINGIYDDKINIKFQRSHVTGTRGNEFKLQHLGSRSNIRRFSFRVRSISIWNSLPNEIVTAGTLNTLKNRIDKFWERQEVKFQYKVNLIGTRSRSIRNVDTIFS
jgi:hypothetical protein